MIIKEFYLKKPFRSLINKRLLVVIGVLSGIFALLFFSSKEFSYYFSEFVNRDLTTTAIPITFLLISAASLSLSYLQSGGEKSASNIDDDLKEKLLKEYILSRKRLDDVVEQISYLKRKIDSYESEKGLSEEEKQKIIDGAVALTSEDAIRKIFTTETEKLEDSIKKTVSFEKLTGTSQSIVVRLRREISDLRLRSNINLLIGMAITAGGLYLLWTTVNIVDTSELLKQLASEETGSNGKFLRNLVLPIAPRVLLVVFVEIFAYFFLRLYKEGLAEIKYFQNELTNVESKLASVEFSFVTNQMDSLKISLGLLSNTERNFILEKGQTTVELEKARSDSELTRNVIKTIPELFKKANK